MKPSEIVRERGWIQHTGSGPNGEVCMGRAICLADHGNTNCDVSCADVWAPFERVTGEGNLTTWNDVPGRTIEQIIALLQEHETGFDPTPAPEISAPREAVPA